jgi:hypothetical protein
MDRKAARADVKLILEALGVFDLVKKGAPGKFITTGGVVPDKVAVISSASMQPTRITRGIVEVASGFTVSVYKLLVADSEEDAEDTLDDLVLAVIQALLASDDYLPAQSTAASGGLPTVRIIDGKLYRVEHIPVTIAADY